MPELNLKEKKKMICKSASVEGQGTRTLLIPSHTANKQSKHNEESRQWPPSGVLPTCGALSSEGTAHPVPPNSKEPPAYHRTASRP